MDERTSSKISIESVDKYFVFDVNCVWYTIFSVSVFVKCLLIVEFHTYRRFSATYPAIQITMSLSDLINSINHDIEH